MYGPREYVEVFHLLFLDQLGRKIDKRGYALKGGCNLRFFFKSLRYSEHMDLDAAESVGKDLLRARVDAILASGPFKEILRVRGMEVTRTSAPKQTATTQRWKVGLSIADSDAPVRTRIEFSRRGMGADVRFEGIDPELTAAYRLSPMMCSHYSAETAARQKIGALLSRRATQARDVFDLNLLIRSGVEKRRLREEFEPQIEAIQDRLMSVTFEVFRGQVLAFLSPEHQAQYDSPGVWEGMVLEVIEVLEGGSE